MNGTGPARRGGRLGFGLIGAGVIAALHAAAITGLDGARLVAVTDVIAAQAAALGREYGCAVEASPCRAAGQGRYRRDGEISQTLTALRADQFTGFVSLEPHLRQAGRFGGFSGPQEFRRAAQALKDLLGELSIPWE